MENLAEKDIEKKIDEAEILIFTIGEQIFGAMVQQVREILMPGKLEPVPNGHYCVEGVYRPRDVLITVINLPKYLGMMYDTVQNTLFIVADVENLSCAFLVNKVLGIEKVDLNTIEKKDNMNLADGVNNGILRINGDLVTLIDLSTISKDVIQ